MSDLTQMDRLASELAGARAVRADAEARSSTIGAASSAGAAASPLLADLQTQEITLQRRIAELSAMYGQGHPDMQNAKAQLSQVRSEEHTSELQSLMRISYAVFCLKKK